MTERLLNRGVFPILSQRPLEDSEVVEPATAKVYVVEVGAYSDRYIDAIFTTRELAEAFVEDRKRRAFEREGRKAERRATGWTFAEGGPTATPDAPITIAFHDNEPPTATHEGKVIATGIATGWRTIPAETFGAFVRRHDMNEFGDVWEYDLWDVLPVVGAEMTVKQTVTGG